MTKRPRKAAWAWSFGAACQFAEQLPEVIRYLLWQGCLAGLLAGAIERGSQSGRGTHPANSTLHRVIAPRVVHTVQSATMGAASEHAERGGACICSISQMQH